MHSFLHLQMLSFVFPNHFLYEDIIQHLLSLLSMEEDYVAPLVLFVLTFLGKFKSLGKLYIILIDQIVILHRFQIFYQSLHRPSWGLRSQWNALSVPQAQSQVEPFSVKTSLEEAVFSAMTAFTLALTVRTLNFVCLRPQSGMDIANLRGVIFQLNLSFSGVKSYENFICIIF